MGQVNTVTGPVGVDQLGRTLMHEHVLTGLPGSEFDPSIKWDRIEVITRAVGRMRDLIEHGVKTFVDPCPIELGRDPQLLAEIADKSGMQIICTTGFYTDPLGLPPYWRARSCNEIAELYVREIETGIGDTGIRAGAIKCATSAADIPAIESLFLEAASKAQAVTGVPIITHTENGQGAPEQLAALTGFGAPPSRCLIGHCCGNPDPVYHERVAAGGAYVGFDRIGMAAQQSDETRADNIAILLDNGRRDQIIMSQDRVCQYVGKLRPMAGVDMHEINAKFMSGELPGPYTDLFTQFLPMLRHRGVTDETIAHILTENPRMLFTAI